MKYNQYIVKKRFKQLAMCGEVNLPCGTMCIAQGGFIYFGEKQLCAVTSQNAYDYFAMNDDGCGLLRGKIIQAIQNTLSDKGSAHYALHWGKIWEDGRCQKYKREDYEDFWLWNHDFFHGPIADLSYIAGLVGAKEGMVMC